MHIAVSVRVVGVYQIWNVVVGVRVVGAHPIWNVVVGVGGAASELVGTVNVHVGALRMAITHGGNVNHRQAVEGNGDDVVQISKSGRPATSRWAWPMEWDHPPRQGPQGPSQGFEVVVACLGVWPRVVRAEQVVVNADPLGSKMRRRTLRDGLASRITADRESDVS